MATLVKFDVTDLTQAAASVGASFEALGETVAEAVNAVAKVVREDSVKKIVSQVALPESYADGKASVKREATPAKPEAVIAVVDEPVFLNRFWHYQKTKSNVWTPSMYAAKFGSLNARYNINASNPGAKPFRPPWIERTGNTLAGIPAGRKPDGMKATISKRYGPTDFRHVFYMKIRSGTKMAGRVGVFQREAKGSDKLEPFYGPSPYQVVKGVWDDSAQGYADILSESVTAAAEAAIKEAIDK